MRIVILTGAGISAESGLGTFRDNDGLWSQYDLAEVATFEGYTRDPEKVLDFYNQRRANAAAAEPNAAHFALASLERKHSDRVDIVTQNIDNLHERAGSRSVVHMHGELFRCLCADCAETWNSPMVMSLSDRCPACKGQRTRPDVVWFGEIPYHMDQITALLGSADLFVSIGTSGQVYPAAGFVDEASIRGARTMELNLERSDVSSAFEETIYGPATEIVPKWVDRVLA